MTREKTMVKFVEGVDVFTILDILFNTKESDYAPVRVKFQDNDLIWFRNVTNDSGGLMPVEFVDQDMNLRPHTTLEDSHAYILEDGRVIRLGEVLGHRDEIKKELQ